MEVVNITITIEEVDSIVIVEVMTERVIIKAFQSYRD